jgi:hypothetical protein
VVPTASTFRRRILAATLVGLTLRLAWWWHARPDPVSDFEYLRRLAEGLLDHQQYGYPRLEGGKVPAYPIVLAGLMLISRSIAWLSLVTALMATSLVPLVGVLARRLGLGAGVAAAASFICALNPTFVLFSPVLATEHLFGAALVGALVVLIGPRVNAPAAGLTMRRCAAAGGLFGLAALSRVDALFYLPVFAGLLWKLAPRRLAGLGVMLVCAGLVLAPWYVRNRVVIGPGAGLSTAGGATFNHGHHDGPYGWRSLAGTPLEGLHQLELHRRGYELGFEYLKRAGVRGIARDVAIATSRQYSPLSSPFALRWSTRRAGATPDEFSGKPVAGVRGIEWLSAGFYAALLGAAMASVFLLVRMPPTAAFVLYGTVFLNWIGHCWIFLGEPRYRFVAEIVFCVLAAAVVHALWRKTVQRRAILGNSSDSLTQL